MTDSNQLLRDYAERGSEAAFRELVGRYIDFVHSVALRRVDGDAHLAEDIVQTVFIDLVRHSGRAQASLLEGPCALGGWLHRHTCFVASNFRRAEQRRQTRERIAVEMNSLESVGEPAWQHLAPVLDEAINELGAEDRDALLLRFYERRDLRAVGAALGVGEDAAQKRVSRGLDKLRALLTQRGVSLSLSVLAGFLAERTVAAAPAYLAPAVSDAALVAGGTAAGTVGASGFLAWLAGAKAKVLVGAVATGLVCATLLLARNRQATGPDTVGPKTGVTQQAQTAANSPGGTPAASQEGSTGQNQALPFEGLRLTLLTADSGKPVPNVAIKCLSWEGTEVTRKTLQGTRAGTCDVPFLRATTTELRLRTQLDGFADTSLQWRPDRGERIPTNYTLRLGRPAPIGGRVLDPDGQPVANAKVSWSHQTDPAADPRPESHAFEWIEVETDASGRWTINRIAEDMLGRLYGSARHSEHARSQFVRMTRDPAAAKQLREGTHVFQLGRVSMVLGVVVDSEDRPVPGARLLVGDVGESNGREATTDADGGFAVAGCKLGQSYLTAEAAGFAPTTMAVKISEDSEPVRIRLATGKTLRLRLVDKAGQPIVGANVWYDPLERGRVVEGTNLPARVQVHWSPITDEQGRAVWENAPDQEMSFDFHKRGHIRVSEVRLRPDGQEHQVTLPPALTISGTVSDATSSKPIPRFRIICGWPQEDVLEGGIHPQWRSSERFCVGFGGGMFRHTLEEALADGCPNPGYVFKFEAEGYAPCVSRIIAPDEGEVPLEVKLQPAQPTTITLLLPDGRPAANAEIGLVSPRAQLRLLPDGFDRRSNASRGSMLSADANGQASLPLDNAIQKIVVVHSQGYAEATAAAIRSEPTLRLQSWGRLEGTYWHSGKPAAGIELLPGFMDGDQTAISFDFELCRVASDAEGRFAFAKVPPVRLRLIRLVPNPQSDGSKGWGYNPLTEVDVRPGETTQIELGKSDRTVVVHLRWPDGWQLQPVWRVAAMICTPVPLPPAELRTNHPALWRWQRRPEHQAASASARFFPLKAVGDGSWKVEAVTPGNYVVRAFVSETNNVPEGGDALRARFEAPVVVAEEASGSVLDLGEVPLQQTEP